MVVVGSGATAVTLVPALAGDAAHVTMLQRSPSYVLSVPTRDPLARKLFGGRLPLRWAAALVRARNIALVTALYRLSRRRPAWMRRKLIDAARAQLPPGFAVDTHFSPAYEPWDQRLCVVPSGDLFRAVREGRASVVTDRIATLTEHGVALASGAELPADVVVTATGLSLQMLGGATLTVDGREVDLGRSVVYQGVLLSGVPNFALTFGYTERLLDAQGGPGGDVRVPAPAVHARARPRRRHPGRPADGRARPADRPAVRVRAARGGPAAPARVDGAVAADQQLPARPAGPAVGPDRRPPPALLRRSGWS